MKPWNWTDPLAKAFFFRHRFMIKFGNVRELLVDGIEVLNEYVTVGKGIHYCTSQGGISCRK